MSGVDGYAELHCLSAFSFQRGASTAAELFQRARDLGYRALAITDECSLAGIVRAWQASRETGVPLVVGSELQVEQGPKLVLLVEDAAGYRGLCRLVTRARRRAPKGAYRLLEEDFDGLEGGLLCLWLPGAVPDEAHGRWLRERFPGRTWLAAGLHRLADDAGRVARWQAAAARLGLPVVAAGDVHMHVRGRRALQDVLTAIRHRTTLAEAGGLLFPNGERHLRPLAALRAIYPRAWLEESVRVAERCTGFDLRAGIDYQYPHELVPPGHDAGSWLRELVMRGARVRWPEGIPEKAAAQIEKELALIAQKRYESYFLTVHDIVRFARERGILCQGRGSAANSAVCFALGITALDPARMDLLFERFISADRDEPPDIDVDFEHERREEVIQYVFARYGRERAALAAVATTYGARGALRDVARVLCLPQDAISRLAELAGHWSDELPDAARLREAGFDPDSPLLRRILALAGQLVDMPHYLSQHPGGFVVSERPLHTMVPVENAAMDGRTVIQWDKDDLEMMGLLKVDVLALGMLTAVRKALEMVARHRGRRYTLATIPAEDPETYRMIQAADTIGVFQIESRAQMAMLPRLRPACFYDLVIEVAIVRPGPIQGDMVHPYLRRRTGEEPVSFPSPALEQVLRRTLGVPLFQEQVMQIAMVAAGYSASEADALRRSMAAWKRRGGLEHFQQRLVEGMTARGYSEQFALQICRQIQGFGEYGFPESHAASFAALAYVSAWLKCHHPAAFVCALLNSQPMGFYAPAQLVRDAREHGVPVRPADVTASDWDCTLEPAAGGALALRLGLRLVKGLSAAGAQRLVEARTQAPLRDVQDLARRARLDRRDLAALAHAGALKTLAGHRRAAWWEVLGAESDLPVFPDLAIAEDGPALPAPAEGEEVRADYASLGLTLGRHPLALLRPKLAALRLRSAAELKQVEHKRLVRTAGLVITRQRPGSASGVTFLTLEDETGVTNVVVWRDLAERARRALLSARLLAVIGIWERRGEVTHLIAGRLEDHSHLLGELEYSSRDFH